MTLQSGSQTAVQGAEPKFAFKDSFDDVAGRDWGCAELFQAHWIRRAPDAVGPTTMDWERIQADACLHQWEQAWACRDGDASRHPRQFPPALLDDSDVAFMAGMRNGRIIAGFILCQTDAVAGLSNQFGDVWPDYSRVAAVVFPGADVVGYERGDTLKLATAAGFTALTTLKVWRPRTVAESGKQR